MTNTQNIVIDDPRYGDRAEFASIEEATATVRTCGPEFANVAFRVDARGAVRNENDEVVGAVVGIKVNDKVEAGSGDDHDTGIVDEINGEWATVRWDSGVVTPCPLADLRLIED